MTWCRNLVLEAKKRVKYIWVPETIIDDWVHKGHTSLNVFSVFGEQIKSKSSKQSKLNFWNGLQPKMTFFCSLLTQTVTWQPNHTIWRPIVKAILKAMTNKFFMGPCLGAVRIFFSVLGFTNKSEHFVADWLDLVVQMLGQCTVQNGLNTECFRYSGVLLDWINFQIWYVLIWSKI